MKKLKKSGIALFAILFAGLLALAGCGSQEVPENTSGQNSATAPVSSQEPSQAPSNMESSETPSQVDSGASGSGGGLESQPNSMGTSSSSSLIVGTPGAIPESPAVESSYFDDAVFVGDSVSLKLDKYTAAKRNKGEDCLGKAKFLTSGSLGSGNALWDAGRKDAVHPTYNGKVMRVPDAVAATGAKKVYIMLGMNDVGLYGIEDSVKNMETLLGEIKQKSPAAAIYVQSATPMLATMQKKQLNNENLKKYDDQLAQMCAKNGYYFIDVASVMRDETGALPRAYCSDPDTMGIHFTDEACAVWVQYLLTHTA